MNGKSIVIKAMVDSGHHLGSCLSQLFVQHCGMDIEPLHKEIQAGTAASKAQL